MVLIWSEQSIKGAAGISSSILDHYLGIVLEVVDIGMIWVISLYNLDMLLAISHSLRHVKFLIFGGLEYHILMILAAGNYPREQTLLPLVINWRGNTQVFLLEWWAHLSQSSIVLHVSE